MSLLAPLAALAFLAVPFIVFLYFLKVRRREVKVGTLPFWQPHVADRQANAPWQKLRYSLLLLLQVMLAGLIAFALMRPGYTGSVVTGGITVVMIDGSPSMQATDVKPSRFESALDQAGDLAAELPDGHTMAVVLLADHARLIASPSSDAHLLRSSINKAKPTGRAGNLTEGISLANAILAGGKGGSMVLLSDGHMDPPDPSVKASAPVRYVSIGKSASNIALDSLVRDSGGAVVVRVSNYGKTPRSVNLEMLGDGKLLDVIPVTVDNNATRQVVWPKLPPKTKVLEARLAGRDSLSLDNAAWLISEPPQPRRVLLVTEGNGFLQRALELQSAVDLTVLEPSAYKPGKYDLYIFDRFIPPGALPNPSWLVAPPEGKGPLPLGPAGDPGPVLPVNPKEPLLQYVNLKDVHVATAQKLSPSVGWRTLIEAAGGPLVAVKQTDPRMAVFTFDLHHSDLPLRASFPILVRNMLTYLLPGGFENEVYAPGDTVRLASRASAEKLEVTVPGGRKVRLGPPFPPQPFVDTVQPGVYVTREMTADAARTGRFVVQMQDPRFSRIAPGGAPFADEDQPEAKGAQQRGVREIWRWVAAFALILVPLEWLVFLRG